jgi:hypothetical protein
MGASASQPKTKRNPVTAWFERRRLRNKEPYVAESPRIIHKEDTGSFSLATQDGGEGKRSVDREAAPKEASDQRSRRDYRYITTQDNARMHIGDTYIERQTVVSKPTRLSIEAEVAKRNAFMKHLGFASMGSRLATIGTAYAETGRWLFDREEFKRWRDPSPQASRNNFLWIKGKPGAGKSTLMKHALQNLRSQKYDTSEILSFFFNARGHDLEKTTEGMYRSLLHQMYKHFPERLPKELPALTSDWRTNGWPLPILQNSLRDALLGFGSENRFVCYIDALDECSEDDIRSAVQYFEELGELAHSRAIGLAICFASRHYPHITLRCYETINLDTEEEHQRDISAFVTRRLRGEHGLRSDLSQQISRRALGVFLWAALVVQMMNKMMDCGATRSQLLSELKLVPDGVEELLKTMILDGDLALLSTMLWVLFSKRQLDIHELYFAVKTSVGQLSTARDDAAETSEEQMRLFILTSSKGLVEFTSGGGPKAQFIHETVREYILNGGLTHLDTGLAGNNLEAVSHARLGQSCHDYIKIFMSSRHEQPPPSFLLYSKEYTLAHMESAHIGGVLELPIIDSIQPKTWEYLDSDNRKSNSSDPILVLLRRRCTGIAAAILQRELVGFHANSPLLEPSTPGDLDKRKIPDAKVVPIRRSDYHNNVLRNVVREIIYLNMHGPAFVPVIELLLECGADPNIAWEYTWNTYFPYSMSPLSPRPKRRGWGRTLNRGLIRGMLKFGVDPDTPISDKSDPATRSEQTSALAIAVELHDVDIVELLLKSGANAQGRDTGNPLCSAAERGLPSIARLLLAAGANQNDRGAFGRTALHENSLHLDNSDKQLAIARALVDAGADIDATDDEGSTAVTLAFDTGKTGLAKFLLDRGASLDMPGHVDIAHTLHTVGNDYLACDQLYVARRKAATYA